ncbi:MAG: PAS domain-containing sensor histidine kinase [Betaproteobacteria bacterium RIFCSPLOWO2_12_FULL_62_13]|nr:MAG: PAS domain-containing sensor histidine kinase [Betaproteobacteria bacterium RIFCSPLOWO2_12_FULL_62_13]
MTPQASNNAAPPGNRTRYLLILCVSLGAVALYLLATASANTALFAEHYSLLLLLNGGVALMLAALVIYQLFTLRRKLRAGVFGAKLTLRLVLLFALMALLPGALIYGVSVQFLAKSIESWFEVRLDRALEGGLALGRNALDNMLRELTVKGDTMALALSVRPASEHLTALNALREQAGVQEATLFSQRGKVIAFSGNESVGLMPEPPGPGALRQIRMQQSYSAIESTPDRGLHLRVLAPVNVLSLAEDTRMLQLMQPVPKQLAQDAETVQVGYREYQELTLARRGLKRLYGITLTLTLLLALLSALALAFLLSDRLSAPLNVLAEGTRAVAQGDFSQRAAVASRDELGMVTRSFNSMTLQLAEARAQAERHQAQLAHAKAYLESILANLSAGVLAFDDRLRLRSANPSAAHILGLECAPLLGCKLQQWGERDASLAPLGREIAAAFERAGSDEWEQQVEREVKGGIQVLLLRGTRLPQGAELGSVVVFDDITHLLQAQRDAAWAEVARRLAHEIKNPLTPIQLSAERLQVKLAPKLAGNDADMLARSTQTIVTQVAALKRMVDAFSQYARTPEPSMRELDINALVREVLLLYESLGSSIRLDLAHHLPPVIGDAAQLRQVIHNLLQNAQDALAGTASPTIVIASEAIGELVYFSVTDNGSGFAEHLMKRVFEPYVTTKPGGTGLGLVIVKKIVEEHGGDVSITNVVPHGARVTVSLPTAAAARRAGVQRLARV